jgi:hypothetical protein
VEVSGESLKPSRNQASNGIDEWSSYPTVRSAAPEREYDPDEQRDSQELENLYRRETTGCQTK